MNRHVVKKPYNNGDDEHHYGDQYDLKTDCTIRFSEKNEEIRLFFNKGVGIVILDKTSSAYKNIRKQFEE
jgi:hypothetical protein